MFTNREQAGQLLSAKLSRFTGKDTLVLGIPRGGMLVAREVGKRLQAPLDVIVIRKITLPQNPELAIGAVGSDNTVYWDSSLCRQLGVDKQTKSERLEMKDEERREREKLLRGDKPFPSIANKVVLVVDDGVATGATSIAAAKLVKKKKAKKSILATPVIATDTLPKVRRYFDEVVYLESSGQFHAVGQFYEEFPQITDDEVIEILKTEV